MLVQGSSIQFHDFAPYLFAVIGFIIEPASLVVVTFLNRLAYFLPRVYANQR